MAVTKKERNSYQLISSGTSRNPIPWAKIRRWTLIIVLIMVGLVLSSIIVPLAIFSQPRHAVAMELSGTHGTVAVAYTNGTTVTIARIEGDTIYQDYMQLELSNASTTGKLVTNPANIVIPLNQSPASTFNQRLQRWRHSLKSTQSTQLIRYSPLQSMVVTLRTAAESFLSTRIYTVDFATSGFPSVYLTNQLVIASRTLGISIAHAIFGNDLKNAFSPTGVLSTCQKKNYLVAIYSRELSLYTPPDSTAAFSVFVVEAQCRNKSLENARALFSTSYGAEQTFTNQTRLEIRQAKKLHQVFGFSCHRFIPSEHTEMHASLDNVPLSDGSHVSDVLPDIFPPAKEKGERDTLAETAALHSLYWRRYDQFRKFNHYSWLKSRWE